MQSAARIVAVATLPWLAALTGCRDAVPPPSEFDYGFLSLTATRDAAGNVVAEPLGIFYRSTQLVLPTSRVARDSCAIRPVTTTTADTVPHVSAGDSITLQLPTHTVSLKPRAVDRLTLYLLPPDSVLRLEGGGQITFRIPGEAGGFPAAAPSTVAPEPFTLGAIPTTPPAGESVAVTWSPAGDADTRMLLFLQYAGLGSSTLDQMVFCSLVDDGSHAIPGSLLGGWRSAFNDLRAVRAIRERITFTDLDQAKLLVTSSFRVDIPNP